MTISLKARKNELKKMYEDSVRKHGGHRHRKISIAKPE
jgi:hypothetical protein